MADPHGRTAKVGIVGVGSVGATLAYACRIRRAVQQLALYDVNARKVEAEVEECNLADRVPNG
jgi:L-lactate dehydrogenase